MKYTSLEFSEKLAEVGFDKESDNYHLQIREMDDFGEFDKIDCGIKTMSEVVETTQERCVDSNKNNITSMVAPAYDILNDLCVKYAKDVWGDLMGTMVIMSDDDIVIGAHSNYLFHGFKVFRLVQQGKQDEAEKYIEENSILFNQEK